MRNSLQITLLVFLQIIIFNECKKGGDKLSVPDIIISKTELSVPEDTPGASINIPVTISNTFDNSVSVEYTTEDSTAIAGKDYIEITDGKLIFQPGETSATIKIDILPNASVNQDVCFRLIFRDPVNCALKGSSLIIKIINVDYETLVWNEEFNAGPLRATEWNFELGAGGWGNNELQTYTNSTDNVHIDTGYLHITALNPYGTYFTSGRITTKGKKEFTYCRIDIRAKLPEGKGIWPALWMLGGNISSVGWPRCGEIDIMELIGSAPSTVYGTVHWDENGHQSNGGSYSSNNIKFSSGFHIYSLIWTPNRITWSVDSYQYFNTTRTEIPIFPFDLPQFLIFNIAVGGNWPGSPDKTTIFPQHLIVDYIRVYK